MMKIIGQPRFYLYFGFMKLCGLTCIVFILFSASLFSQDFKTSTASGVDLLKYETFTVVPGSVITNSDQPINKEAFYDEIKSSIIRELEVRGYKFLNDSTAQLTVSYVIETSVKMDVQQQGRLGQQVVVTNPAGTQTQNWSREFTQGMLILEIEDTARSTAVWSAEGIMDINRTRGGNLLDNAVRSAFRKFPDKNKKVKKRN
jgi:hypothetical protein